MTMLLEIFCYFFDRLNKMIVDNMMGGSIVKMHHHPTFLLTGEASKQNRGWHTQDTKVPKILSATSMVDNKQRKRNED